jgi:BirA family biotin operon repressor/biotin-[acetyl-CoA-carboxylase] ligase
MELDLPAPYALHAKVETASTNVDAIRLAEAGAPDYTIVWARSQTAGRGRFRRPWLSEPGNLYCSIVLRITDDRPTLDTLPIVSGLAVGRTVAAFVGTGPRVELKWMNDVLVDGRKIAGILSEGSYDTGWVVVGIGVNVSRTPEIHDRSYRATCIAEASGRAAQVANVLPVLAAEFHRLVEQWRADGLAAALRDEYLARMWRLGRPVDIAFDADKSRRLSGINRGIDESGRLLLELPDGTLRTVLAGDVL